MTTFLDTNILIKLLDPAAQHHDWSLSELERCQRPAIISDIVYCEFCVGMPSRDAVDAAVIKLALERVRSSDAALFRASEAFKVYRDVNKGSKTGVLPDFIIGAVAEVSDAPLITTNAKDFTGYFPKLKLISPT